MKQIIATVLLLALVVAGYFAWKTYRPAPSGVPINITTFSCDQGKTIGAVFYNSKVELILSDGRKLFLPKTISASGARYANADESFVFWNKGNTAYVGEGFAEPQAQTYVNCVAPGNVETGEEMISYAYPPLGFSVKYPRGYVLDDAYAYDQLGPEAIPGVKFSIPQSRSEETNLSSDTGVSVEYFPEVESCTADIFLFGNPAPTTETIGGVTYSVASASDAGAGNLYEEKVYALSGQNPCIAIRYFIHYTQIGNYPAGTKEEFDRAALLAEFDSIRNSLTQKAQVPAE